MREVLIGLGIGVGGMVLGALALGIVTGIGTVLCWTAIMGWHGVVWLARTPLRRREQATIERHRWETWRPKQDLRHLPH